MPKQPFSYDEFKSIYSKVPRLAVDLIIQSEQGILLSMRQIPPYKGQWHLPGGTVYYKESIENAVHRFADEEVGVKIEIKELLGYITYNSEEKERGFGYSVALAFLCKLTSGTPRASEQGNDFTYFKEIPENTVIDQKEFLLAHKLT